MNDFESKVLVELHAIRETLEKIAFKPSSTTNPESITSSVDRSVNTASNIVEQGGVNQGTSNKLYYFGTPDGDGFENCNAINDSEDSRILYAIETDNGINGKYYPIGRALSRLKSNASSLLLPMCELNTPIDSLENLSILPNNYGDIKLEEGFWKIVRKCTI